MACSLVNTRSPWNQICMHYRSIFVFTIEILMQTQVIWKKSQNNVKIWPLFEALSSISPKIIAVSIQHYAWLKSYGCNISFGTNISGSLFISPMLWVLSSRNTISVTHSDTALYTFASRVHCNILDSQSQVIYQNP